MRFKHGGASHEVDFVTGDVLLGEVFKLIQVSIDIESEKTRKRELRALEAGMAKYGIGESVLVTMDTEETVDVESGVIRVVPAWKWLLD